MTKYIRADMLCPGDWIKFTENGRRFAIHFSWIKDRFVTVAYGRDGEDSKRKKLEVCDLVIAIACKNT
jgi:hypothetical protein